MRIVAHTPRGTFVSKDHAPTPEELRNLHMLLTDMDNAKFFYFETETGRIYLAPEMIKSSVFVLEDLPND
jgi:hypothetical protein